MGDTNVIFETSVTSPFNPPSWVNNYVNSEFGVLAYGANIEQMRVFVAQAISKNIGYIYVTDLDYQFWRSIPSYLAEEAALLAGVGVVPTNTPTTIPPSITPSLTPTKTATPSMTPSPTYTPTASPTVSITPTNTVPAPGSLTCVFVTWTRGLNLRPTPSMDNTPYYYLYFGYGAVFPVQRIFENEEGIWMQVNEHLYSAMYLNANGKIYAIEAECP